jgi:hypothetical protein
MSQTPSYERSSMVCTKCGVDNNVGNRYCSCLWERFDHVAQNIQGIVCEKCGQEPMAANIASLRFELTNTTTICQACGLLCPQMPDFVLNAGKMWRS